LQENAETIRIDDSSSPNAVILKSAEDEPTKGQLRPFHQPDQVRPDLWRAILDYSSGSKYEWDAAAASAKTVTDEGPGPFLPTLSQNDLRRADNRLAGREPSNRSSSCGIASRLEQFPEA
jgi:hypothetical protein